jgi:hypothetical protein
MMPSTLRPKPSSLKQKDQNIISPEETQFLGEKKQELPTSLPSTLKPKKKEQFPYEGENDLDREIERNVAQGTSRMLETALGMPGDLYSFAKSIFGFSPETNLPTSQSLRKFSEKATLGYTKPKSELEEKGGEIFQDIASFMIPGSKQYSMMRNIGIPIVANLAKEGIKMARGEKSSDAAKFGLMVTLDLMANRSGMGGGAKKYAGKLFQEAEKSVPKGLSINASNLNHYLTETEKELSKGGSRPSTKQALEKIKEIKAEIKNGKIDLKNLIAYRPAINEVIDDLGGFEYILKPKIKEKIIKNMQEVKKSVIKSSEEYGDRFNPKFLNLSRSANEAWAAYEKSNKIANFLNKHFGKKALGVGVKTILGIGAPVVGAAKVGAALTTAIGTPLTLSYQAFKILNRVKNSPTLRKYYGNILLGATKGNIPQVSRNLSALNKELEEQDQE